LFLAAIAHLGPFALSSAPMRVGTCSIALLVSAGAAVAEPRSPQPILQGGVVVPLYPPGSPRLKADRLGEAETLTTSKTVPGRITSIVNIHNPSIEVHVVEGSLNTGTAVILAAGGGHRTLNVGSESADLVPFFFNYGVNTVILRNRLRSDGYDVRADAVTDALQAIRLVRSRAKEWNIDPKRIGIMGFSAGAELAAAAAIDFQERDTAPAAADPLARVSSRPDFAALVYPGPSPFARGGHPVVPREAVPAFVTGPGSGDQVHAVWAVEFFTGLLQLGVPNIELHVYASGRHPGEALSDGGRMTAGISDRNGMPFGTWHHRFIEWCRDLGFLQKPGIETKAARDVAAFAAQPRRPGR
jgi:endo-1,4-beta-xylanase